jgi:hypothetical protein
MQISVSQLTTYIITLVTSLEFIRRELFLNWLCAHSSQEVYDEESDLKHIQDALVKWFESLSERDVLQEFFLVTGEISWWRNLDDESLANFRTKMKNEKNFATLCLSDEN